MALENQTMTGHSTLTRENYHIWVIEMKVYLRGVNKQEDFELREPIV